MVAISRQYPFGAERAVQIRCAVFLIKGHNPKFDTKMQNPLINQDIRFSLYLALLGSNCLKISILLYYICTHNWKMCPEVLTFKMATKELA